MVAEHLGPIHQHVMPLENLEQAKPMRIWCKEKLKVGAEINEMETKKQYKESMKQKFGSL
jgi:hypothetical protein